MDRKAIEQRQTDLQKLQAEQKARLETAQGEIRGAQISLERIEGALQDCDFWLSQLPGQDAPEVKIEAAPGQPAEETPAAEPATTEQ